jgi:hypothetical protein
MLANQIVVTNVKRDRSAKCTSCGGIGQRGLVGIALRELRA